MKRRSLLVAACWISLIILNGCNRCKDDCGDCGTLDQETCECIVDIDCRCNNEKLDGDEIGIDCGGSCGDCVCDFEPCSLLTDDDDKLWKYVETIDGNGDIVTPDECDLDWTYTFYVERFVEFGCPQNMRYNTNFWEFDDPESPTQLIFTDVYGNQFGYDIYKLSADTLQILERIGLSTYIPG